MVKISTMMMKMMIKKWKVYERERAKSVDACFIRT